MTGRGNVKRESREKNASSKGRQIIRPTKVVIYWREKKKKKKKKKKLVKHLVG